LSAIYACSGEGALRQGEMVTGLVQVRLAINTVGADKEDVQWIEEFHPFAVVLSQDCDLDQDWKVRQSAVDDPKAAQRQLPSVLFAQVHDAEELKGRVGASDLWKRVKQNKDERYHFLEAVSPNQDALADGLPELGIDFKRYFTIPTDELYRRIEKGTHRRCRLVSPYLEHLSTRFCYYQFRVALPSDHKSNP
jgi:hypothetical protein